MSSRKEQRLEKLLEIVVKEASLHIRDAAELLDVSEMTVRRDVRDNSDKFSSFGGHIMPANVDTKLGPYDLSQAVERFEKEKKQACLHCLEYIKPKDTIFVDCGTTLLHLINLLPTDLEVTIVCYAMNIADRAVRKPNVRLILAGGIYQPATTSFSQLENSNFFDGIAINVGFFTAAGLDAKLGATCTTFREADQKRAAMAKSSKCVLVVDSSKIGVIRPACFGQTSDFDVVLTQNGEADLETLSV